jgi:hypothetical protein
MILSSRAGLQPVAEFGKEYHFACFVPARLNSLTWGNFEWRTRIFTKSLTL